MRILIGILLAILTISANIENNKIQEISVKSDC